MVLKTITSLIFLVHMVIAGYNIFKIMSIIKKNKWPNSFKYLPENDLSLVKKRYKYILFTFLSLIVTFAICMALNSILKGE